MAVTRFVAKAILLDSKGDFLLLKRSETHPRLAGFYDLPGGTVELSEDSRTAVIREIFEETAIELSIDQVRVVYTTTHMIHGKSYPTMLYLVRVPAEKPEVTISWEHESYEWAGIERLEEVEPQIAPTYREALDYIRENNILEDIDTN